MGIKTCITASVADSQVSVVVVSRQRQRCLLKVLYSLHATHLAKVRNYEYDDYKMYLEPVRRGVASGGGGGLGIKKEDDVPHRLTCLLSKRRTQTRHIIL